LSIEKTGDRCSTKIVVVVVAAVVVVVLIVLTLTRRSWKQKA